MTNTLSFAGNLAADPELRYTPSGTPVANFTVIENRPKRTEAGEWEDGEPNSYRCQAWTGQAENLVESCRKGDRVVVTGTIFTDRWTDKESGEARTMQRVRVADVGFSLRYHTVQATKATRGNDGQQPPAQDEPPF